MSDHPFQPGVRVAIRVDGGWREPHSYRLGTVAKVRKDGKFLLGESPQQWRAWEPASYRKHWYATATGSSNGELRLFDDESRDEVEAQVRKAKLCKRYAAARYTIDREPFSELVTEDVVRKLEEVVAAIKPPKTAPAPPSPIGGE